MKKKILLFVLALLSMMLCFVACKGDKAPESLAVLEGIKTEYENKETVDFSGVKVLVTYNDGTTETVGADQLTITALDTNIAGNKKITITYKGISLDVHVTVKEASIPGNVVPKDPVLQSISYVSGLPTKIFEGDPISADTLVVLATYDNGTKATITAGNLTTNIASLDFNTAGFKTVVITYQGKTCEFIVEVEAPQVVSIEVKSGTINTVVEAGGTLDTSTIEVYKVYNNGAKVLIPREELDLTTGMPDLSVEGKKDYVIYYGEFSAKIVIDTQPPELEAITLTGNLPTTILIGDTLSVAGVTANAQLSNLTVDAISNSELTFSYDVSNVGVATVTVSYTLDGITKTATFDVRVLGIKSIELDGNSVPKAYAGESFDTTKVKVVITADDDSIYTRSVADGVVIDTANLDLTSVSQDTCYITASYRGVTSAAYIVNVYDKDINYYLSGVSLPDSLALLDTKKVHFKNQSYGYVVGDDNGFIFKLSLKGFYSPTVPIESNLAYVSQSEVYLADSATPLAGDELASYVAIDESKNSFDFTEAAIGKTFTIKSRPKDGVPESKIAEWTKSITVTVVDGYNVYEAWELNYLTNWDFFEFSEVYGAEFTQTQVQIVDEYLRTSHNATRPENLAGIVLHNDLFVTPADLPSRYFVDNNRDNELYDHLAVFAHITTAAAPHFTFHGNYYTVCSNPLPTVCADGTGNQTDSVSNSELFGFGLDYALREAGPYDHTQYSTTISNLFIRDNHPNSDKEQTVARDMRGVIGLKTWHQIINIDNVRAEAFYITYLADSDYQTVNINDTIFYNAWQNHLFVWSENDFGGDNDAPAENHPTLTVNATNSSFTKCGGPVIIAQTNYPEYAKNSKSGAIINIDGESFDAWTYVTGSEAWFGSMGAGVLGAVADQIKGLNPLLYGYTGGSFVTNTPPVDGLTGAGFMNITMINLTAGMDLNATLNGTTDLDGKFTIGGQTVLDMSDLGVVGGIPLGYANQIVAMIKAQYPQAPVFVSSEGGIGIVNQNGDGSYALITNVYTMLSPYTGMDAATAAYMDAQNLQALGYGNYLTLYYNNMGIVLGYNIDNPERHKLPQ